MKQRFGALLCLAFGAVLIFGSVGFSAAGSVGSVVPSGSLTAPASDTTTITAPASDSTTTVPPTDPCLLTFRAKRAAEGGFCGLGTITVTETTTANGQTPPESWTVTLDSANCALPSGVEADHTFADNGSTSYTGLYVYTNDDRTAQCSYTLSKQAVANFDGSFSPDGPYTFSDEFNLPGRAGPHVVGLAQPVIFSNVGQGAPISSSAPSSAAAPSDSVTAISGPGASASAGGANSSSAAPVLATTGPHEPLRVSLIIGIVLCIFGGVLLIAGRRPRGSRHS